jgi:hypothetical protein
VGGTQFPRAAFVGAASVVPASTIPLDSGLHRTLEARKQSRFKRPSRPKTLSIACKHCRGVPVAHGEGPGTVS